MEITGMSFSSSSELARKENLKSGVNGKIGPFVCTS